ncbi:nucleoside phosphorylase [Lactobacillus helveticus]|uniref:Uridine phosphorylase n=1 Tax=Lactobacillus helveticus TaxID=1587 RepID=A0A3Q8SP05_LACHE|nr:nucleoside phosphorylase [Lactobacillus helveticus]AFR22096.1 putative phosphorylase [Lactobacillus helveticus R0052]AZK90731.1 AMP nucleosidase [Lactobacillus helveticus]MCJ2191130.1 nucleoside phosphorylase [Lactobacillus helveticus]MED7629026.1 phosphorylase [Lactobacillus helveticus]MZR06628.1 phosphorylase [Lactobacillus helveticus]
MSEKPFILDFDNDQHAVLEPEVEHLPFKFHSKLLYAFVPASDIENFLKSVPHKVLGKYDTISFQPNIYEIEINHEKMTLCQAPLGAAAATMLLDWLIAYGVKQVLAFGNAGAIKELPENAMFLPVKAIRGEGTSFYYKEPGQFIDMRSNYLNEIGKVITDMNLDYDEITTWTTDGFFRETSKKVKQFQKLGAVTIEMECAAIAACAQFRKVEFAQILFTADSLANIENYDYRNWGHESHAVGLDVCSQILSRV